MNKTFDRYTGLALLAVGVLFVIESLKISNNAYGSSVGPGIFPLSLGSILCLLSVRLIYETFRYPEARNDDKEKDALDYKRFLLIFGAAVLYAFFLETIGYVICTFLFLLFSFEVMKRGQIWKSILISAVFSIGVYYLYVNVLNGALPAFPEWLGLS